MQHILFAESRTGWVNLSIRLAIALKGYFTEKCQILS